MNDKEIEFAKYFKNVWRPNLFRINTRMVLQAAKILGDEVDIHNTAKYSMYVNYIQAFGPDLEKAFDKLTEDHFMKHEDFEVNVENTIKEYEKKKHAGGRPKRK